MTTPHPTSATTRAPIVNSVARGSDIGFMVKPSPALLIHPDADRGAHSSTPGRRLPPGGNLVVLGGAFAAALVPGDFGPIRRSVGPRLGIALRARCRPGDPADQIGELVGEPGALLGQRAQLLVERRDFPADVDAAVEQRLLVGELGIEALELRLQTGFARL